MMKQELNEGPVNSALSWTLRKDDVTDPKSHGQKVINNTANSDNILSTYAGYPVLKSACGSFYFTLKTTLLGRF